jgi:uncharacterized protein YndB with AHSA1/START domain
MHAESYTRNIEIAASPANVFRALTKELHKWWTTSAEDASAIGQTATSRFGESYQTIVVKDLVPERRVVWGCVEHLQAGDTRWVHGEWVGTRMIWKIEPGSPGSRLTLVHRGLIPQLDCYDIWKEGWDRYAQSLKSYLETGTGSPYQDSALPGATGKRP